MMYHKLERRERELGAARGRLKMRTDKRKKEEVLGKSAAVETLFPGLHEETEGKDGAEKARGRRC